MCIKVVYLCVYVYMCKHDKERNKRRKESKQRKEVYKERKERFTFKYT